MRVPGNMHYAVYYHTMQLFAHNSSSLRRPSLFLPDFRCPFRRENAGDESCGGAHGFPGVSADCRQSFVSIGEHGLCSSCLGPLSLTMRLTVRLTNREVVHRGRVRLCQPACT